VDPYKPAKKNKKANHKTEKTTKEEKSTLPAKSFLKNFWGLRV